MKRRIITRSNVEQSSQKGTTAVAHGRAGGRRLLCMIATVVMVVPLFVMASPRAEANTASPVGGGVFFIRSHHHDIYRLDRGMIGGTVTYRRSASDINQRWVIQQTGVLGDYRIVSENGGARLVADASGNNITMVAANISVTGNRDIWRFVRYQTNQYQIINVGRNMRLTASRFGSGLSDIEPVRLEARTGALGQRHIWRFSELKPSGPTGSNPTKGTRGQYAFMASEHRFQWVFRPAGTQANQQRNVITSRFGHRPGLSPSNHRGIDIAGHGVGSGTNIHSPGIGRVVEMNRRPEEGFYIIIELDAACPVVGRPILVLMNHLQFNPSDSRSGWTPITLGQRVSTSTVVGRVGASGNANGAHLCLEFSNAQRSNIFSRSYYNRINPLFFFYRRHPYLLDISRSSMQCSFWDVETRYAVNAGGRTSCHHGHATCRSTLSTHSGRNDRRWYISHHALWWG